MSVYIQIGGPTPAYTPKLPGQTPDQRWEQFFRYVGGRAFATARVSGVRMIPITDDDHLPFAVVLS